jgi:hypothetical protein
MGTVGDRTKPSAPLALTSVGTCVRHVAHWALSTLCWASVSTCVLNASAFSPPCGVLILCRLFLTMASALSSTSHSMLNKQATAAAMSSVTVVDSFLMGRISAAVS